MSQRLAQELNALRARCGINQTDLGKVIGVTQTQMSQRLRGNLPFSLDEVERFADYFDMEPLQLLGAAETGPNGPASNGPATGVTVAEPTFDRWLVAA